MNFVHVLSNVHYISFRLIRKFILTHSVMHSIRRVLPNKLYSTVSEIEPTIIANNYISYCKNIKYNPTDKNILEIGTGSTKSVAYEFISNIPCNYTCYEPYVPLNQKLDAKFKKACRSKNKNLKIENINSLTDLNSLPENSIDIIFSKSVLEHAVDFDSLLTDLNRVLKPDGIMIHEVDYRDHFFKYPYHFLQFNDWFWNTFLNPGTLPRVRLNNHLEIFAKHNYSIQLIKKEIISSDFEHIKPFIHRKFSANLDETSVSFAVIVASKKTKP